MQQKPFSAFSAVLGNYCMEKISVDASPKNLFFFDIYDFFLALGR